MARREPPRLRQPSQAGQMASTGRPSSQKGSAAAPAPPHAADEWESENGYRIADRQFHAALAAFTLGFSPISLLKAWQDWMLHLAIAPGKQQEIATKGIETLARLQQFLAAFALNGDEAEPRVRPLPQDQRFQHVGWQTFPFSFIHQSFLLSRNGGTMPWSVCPG